MSKSKKQKLSRPRSGITPDERRLEHQRHRAQVKQQMDKTPDEVANKEAFHEQGDIWNWD